MSWDSVHLRTRTGWWIAGAMAAILATPATSAAFGWSPAHVYLESSVPKADALLTAVPEYIELRFSGPVSEGLSSAVLAYPSGDSLSLVLRAAGDHSILVAESPPLEQGEHVLRWRTVSTDGHPAEGEFRFTMAAGPEGAADSGATTPASPDHLHVAEAGEDRAESIRPIGNTLLAGLGLVCLVAFVGMLWHAGATLLVAEPAVRRPLSVLGWTAVVLLLVEAGVWLLQARLPGSGLSGLWPALTSRTGVVSTIRFVLLIAAVLTLRSRGRQAAVLGLAALLIGAAAGHPAAISPWIAGPANAVHLGAAAMWLGGLFLLVLAPDAPSDGSDAWRYEVVTGAVSATALVAVLLVTASGILQSVVLVGDVGAYTGTTYGRTIFVKWAGFTILLGFGAYHRFRIMPALAATGADVPDDSESGGPSASLRRSVRLEAIVMMLVILVAAFLAHTPPPAGH